MASRLGLILILSMTIAFAGLSQAEAIKISNVGNMGTVTVNPATPQYNDGYAIGIRLSGTLEALAKISDPRYPTYSDLYTYDNSTQRLSGKFVTAGTFFHRDCTGVKNSMGPYQYDPSFRVFVDPCKDARLQIITIESRMPEWHTPSQLQIMENKTIPLKDFAADQFIREYSKYRYVDSSCDNASISADNWKTLLPDTITYMQHDCDPAYTKIQTIFNDTKPITQHDVATSAKYKLDTFYQSVRNQCTKTYGGCKIVNKQVTTKGDSR